VVEWTAPVHVSELVPLQPDDDAPVAVVAPSEGDDGALLHTQVSHRHREVQHHVRRHRVVSGIYGGISEITWETIINLQTFCCDHVLFLAQLSISLLHFVL
jgi:hypothetical protein